MRAIWSGVAVMLWPIASIRRRPGSSDRGYAPGVDGRSIPVRCPKPRRAAHSGKRERCASKRSRLPARSAK